jgi:hypothetical protein
LWALCVPILASCLLYSSGRGAQLNGETLPETQSVGGAELHLNGIGLRTYSFFEVPIYVAGLYLPRLDSDAGRILASAETKLLKIRFIHDVSAEKSRAEWRKGLERNCVIPCRLVPEDVERFLAGVPDMHRGDRFDLMFTPTGAAVFLNGRQFARIPNPRFASAMLAVFIGPKTTMPQLKQEILGSLSASR